MKIYLLSLLFVLAGLNHFRAPNFYRPMMPPWIPFHEFCIYASGVAEVLLGLALLYPAWRVYAGWGLLLLLIAVFPANIYMFQERAGAFAHLPAWLLLLRLPLQAALMWWVYRAAIA